MPRGARSEGETADAGRVSGQVAAVQNETNAARGLSSGCSALKILGIYCVSCAKEMPLGGRVGEATPEGFRWPARPSSG